MDSFNVEHLRRNKETFVAAKESILSEWVDFTSVKEIFKKHSINQVHFLERFATGVFDYFMRVISGEVKLGECPVMEQFLLYLKDVEISSQELFEICTHFKRAMIDFSYDAGINSKEMFDEITFVFDRNFSSILKYYSDTIYAKEQEIIKNMELLSEYKKAIDESSLVYKVDSNGKIVYVNDKLLELSGYEIDDIIGANYNFLRYDENEKQQCEEIWRDIEKSGIYRGIVKNRKKDGSYFYLNVTMLKLYNPHDNAEEYMVIAYDVTTLIDARIEAIKASEAKEYFLSNMSHEIRTPLNAILGFVSLLLDEEKDIVHKKYLEIIAKSGENLLSIINDILDFSKIRSGEFVIEPKEFLVYEELTSVLELFSASALSKNIEIVPQIQPSMPSVMYADILRIKQIVSNFLSNAIKFTKNGGRIIMDAHFEDGKLEISVIDNGIGIKKEDLENIFQAFAQVNENSALYGGTGLGLSISYQLAKHMGGEIYVESIYGLGSKFTLEVPVEIVHTPTQLDNPLLGRGHVGMEHFSGKVLVADDNEANQALIKVLLGKLGLEYDIASDGVEAVELFEKNRYDLILMDEQMPNMNGIEAVERIRRIEQERKLPRTPISAITANVIKGAREYDLDKGFDEFLGKPIDLDEFKTVLAKYLPLRSRKESPVAESESEHLQQSASLQLRGIDKEKLLKELALEEDELKMLLELFLSKMKKIVPKLQEAVAKREYSLIAKYAHNIKGSSGNFRLEEVQKYASEMEKMAKNGIEDFDYTGHFEFIQRMLGAIELL